METFYLIVFLVSITIIVLITVFGDLLDSLLDLLWSALLFNKFAILSPVPMFASLSAFGITGYLLSRATSIPAFLVFVFAIAMFLVTMLALYYLIVKPRDISETSLSFSIKQTVGLQGTVSVPIPATGFGEVMIKIGGGMTNQIAASYDNVDITQDEKVFVVDEKEGVLYVSILTI